MTHYFDLSPEQMEALLAICDDMEVDDNFQSEDPVMQEHLKLSNACDDIREDLDCMMLHADQFGWDLRYKNKDAALASLEQFVKEYNEVFDDMYRLMTAAKGMIAAFRDLTQCNDFEITCPDEEIKAAIAEYLTDDTQMGVSYQDGKFVLVFGQVQEESYIQDPVFIKEIATGCEDAIIGVNRYIMTLMNATDADDVLEEDDD